MLIGILFYNDPECSKTATKNVVDRNYCLTLKKDERYEKDSFTCCSDVSSDIV